QAIMQQLGLGGGGLGGGLGSLLGGGGLAGGAQNPAQAALLQQQLLQVQRRQQGQGQQLAAPLVLKPGDTVLVDVTLPSPQPPPSAPPQFMTAPAATSAAPAAGLSSLGGLPLSPNQLAQLQQLAGNQMTPSALQSSVPAPQPPPEELAASERERLENL